MLSLLGEEVAAAHRKPLAVEEAVEQVDRQQKQAEGEEEAAGVVQQT